MQLHKFTLLISLALASAAAAASDDWRDIRLPNGSRFTAKDHVQVRGAWTALGDYAKPRVPTVNATVITCLKEQMQCIESLGYLKQSGPQPSNSSPSIYAFTAEYVVKEWNSQRIVATRVNPRGGPIDSTMTIPLGKGNVHVEWREREGDSTFEPQVQAYEIDLTYAF